MPGRLQEGARFPLASAFGLYTAAFIALAWPWLSGAVTIPYDAVSQFDPPFAFIARSIASGQSPFWTPNIFAGCASSRRPAETWCGWWWTTMVRA